MHKTPRAPGDFRGAFPIVMLFWSVHRSPLRPHCSCAQGTWQNESHPEQILATSRLYQSIALANAKSVEIRTPPPRSCVSLTHFA
jgi:hypothetical protein